VGDFVWILLILLGFRKFSLDVGDGNLIWRFRFALGDFVVIFKIWLGR
jgi:hypothetical protein